MKFHYSKYLQDNSDSDLQDNSDSDFMFSIAQRVNGIANLKILSKKMFNIFY